MIQIGWKAGPEQYGPQDLLNYTVAADEAGFDLLDVSDHFSPGARPGNVHLAGPGLERQPYRRIRSS